MKILIVEDDPRTVAIFQDAFGTLVQLIDVAFAKSRDSAHTILGQVQFDWVVLDLRIPTQDGALDAHTDHGFAVYARIDEVSHGTPVTVFSAYGDENILPRLLEKARKGDPLGLGQQQSMLNFLRKSELPECISRMEEAARSLAALEDIEIASGGIQLELGDTDRRILRIFARRKGGVLVTIVGLGGGLTGSRVLRVRVADRHGALVSQVVAKLGPIPEIHDERQKYESFVVPILPPGSFATLADIVEDGAGSFGGLFYTLAQGYELPLFEALRRDPAHAVLAVGRLKQLLGPWREGAPLREEPVERIRAKLIDREAMAGVLQFLDGVDLGRVEQERVYIRECPQHGDLHGLNVLLNAEYQPTTIDFGRTGRMSPSLDPLTLELSLLFHPAARGILGHWPTLEHLERWSNLDEYLQGCPVANYVRECRQWAHQVAAGDREVYATALAYCVRQLRYPDVNRDLAVAIIKSTAQALQRT